MEIDYKEMHRLAVEMLKERGVELVDIAKITYAIQEKYYDDITVAFCLENVEAVVGKREVIHTIWTALELDRLAEEGKIREPLATIISNDHGLYGLDEVLAYSIANLYGSIGLTNFGYVDKVKYGIIGDLDKWGKEEGRCFTFLDDIVAAIAAAAASRIAHAKG